MIRIARSPALGSEANPIGAVRAADGAKSFSGAGSNDDSRRGGVTPAAGSHS